MRDLVVVGAGPAGSQLAKKFARQGKSVLVIERSGSVGTPLACSGHVSPDIKKFLSTEEFNEILQNSINGAKFHAGGSYRFYRDENVSHVIDRVEFDRKKAAQAEDAGAEIKLGETVEEVREKNDKVIVETDEGRYEALMVAGCDGASSRVRRELDLPEPDHFYQGVLCFTEEQDSSDFVDVVLEVPEFFGWRIPRGDSVEYGVAVPKGEEPMKWLEEITERFDVAEKKNVCAGAIPIGPPGRITSDRVFLVGDAAAQTKPFTGGGILYGMRAADSAAETINPEEPGTLDDYEDLWRNKLEKEIRLGKIIESFYSIPQILQRPVLRLFQGEIGVHMDKPTSLLSIQQIKAMAPGAGIKNFQKEKLSNGE
ncbi:MAG: geranylgeranyl reductase family protein [Candidatus Nanosalina sp.]